MNFVCVFVVNVFRVRFRQCMKLVHEIPSKYENGLCWQRALNSCENEEKEFVLDVLARARSLKDIEKN